MTCAAKNPITGVKYIEYLAEDRNVDGCWGVLVEDIVDQPAFKWLGLATEFIPPQKELYEETAYLGASTETHTLELNRNTSVGQELNASLKYIMQNWDLMEYITGSPFTGLSDTVDSISMVAYLDDVTVDKWTVLTGGMLTKWGLSVPVDGLATVDVDIMFADADFLTTTDPIGGAGSHASELATAPYTWNGITDLFMDANDIPVTSFKDIVGDIGLTITSDVEMSKGVDSAYSTKGSGVTINSRKVEVSLDLTYVSPYIATFQTLVANHIKQNIKFTLGEATITVSGLLFPEWVAELKPGELVGQTVTSITDLSSMLITIV